MRLPTLCLLMLLAGLARSAPVSAGPEPAAADPVALRKQYLAQVEAADRSVVSAQTDVMKAVSTARDGFGEAALLLRASKHGMEVDASAAVGLIAKGVVALLQGLDLAGKHLQRAEASLEAARDGRAALDRALAAQEKELREQLAAMDRDIEVQRKRVQVHWNHYRSPRTAYDHSARRGAMVKLQNLMNEATAAWRERERQRVEAEAARGRRRRLTYGARAVQTRLAEVRALRKRAEQFRESLLNPLDGRKPKASIDKIQDWPKPLLPALAPIDERVAPPKLFKPPDHWKIEHRIKRFLTGGSP